MTEPRHIMIVDDEQEIGELLGDYLRQEGYLVTVVSSPAAALSIVSAKSDVREVDLVISDIHMPELGGFEFMDQFLALRPHVPFIFITAFGSPDYALEAARRNAVDYIIKPFKLDEVKESIEKALEFALYRTERHESGAAFNVLEHILGKSPVMRRLFGIVGRVAHASANILITGESGTGKEMIARAIHGLGARRHKSFVVVDCACIPESLLESELFGHGNGAFRDAAQQRCGLLEAADGGTLFFDEIGDLSLPLQAKLLRFLQERSVRPIGESQYRRLNVRILAATHKNLRDMVKDGSFREDLFFRLSVVPIAIPPLRERGEDILLLAKHFLTRYGEENKIAVKEFTDEALTCLLSASWPGNVRELQNMVERAVVLSDGGYVGKEHLQGLDEGTTQKPLFSRLVDDFPTLASLEDRYIKMILERTGFHKERAAKILGIHRRTLYRKEREYQLDQQPTRGGGYGSRDAMPIGD